MRNMPTTPVRLQKLLKRLKDSNSEHTRSVRRTRTQRKSLSSKQREMVLQKTGGRCHICGQKFAANRPWVADHVHSHASGGKHTIANYLPAHAECNKDRWHYSPERWRWIMRFGMWMQGEIARGTSAGKVLATLYLKNRRGRTKRRIR